SAALMTQVRGYTPLRFLYDDGDVQIYVAYTSKNAVATVMVWNGHTKVIPTVPNRVLNLGGGKVLLFKTGGRQFAIVDVTK
nr:hypothetical protein [Clostridiales bacterium]